MPKPRVVKPDPVEEWADAVVAEVVALELACARHVLGNSPSRMPTEEQAARIAFLLAMAVQRSAGSDVADALLAQGEDESESWKRTDDDDDTIDDADMPKDPNEEP